MRFPLFQLYMVIHVIGVLLFSYVFTIFYWFTLLTILLCMTKHISLSKGGSIRDRAELNIFLRVDRVMRLMDYLFYCFLISGLSS